MYTPDQTEAINHVGHLLIAACPGSGKTTVLIQRAIRILQSNQQHRVLIVTFTRAAAKSASQKLGKAGIKPRQAAARTFDSCIIDQMRSETDGKRPPSGFERAGYANQALRITGFAFEGEPVEFLERIEKTLYPGRDNEMAALFYRNYRELLARHGLFDFSEIARQAVFGMRRGVIQPVPFTHILVDEFQDTDEIQWAWVDEHRKAGAEITAVGDDDQSIYGFRAALGYAGMARFERDAGAHRVTLATCFRCRQEILNTASNLISHNVERIPKKLVSGVGTGGNVQMKFYHEEQEEVDAILDHLRKWVMDNEASAVLARTNRRLDFIEASCNSIGLKVMRLGGSSIWERDGPSVMLGLCEAMGGMHPKRGFHHAARWAGVEEEDSWEILNESTKELYLPEEAKDLRKMWNMAQSGEFEPRKLIERIAQWVKDFSSERYDCGITLSALRILYKQEGSLIQRVAKVRALSIQDQKGEEASDAKVVTLATLHGSKGLEWDRVWISGVEEGVLPHPDGDIDEERRLLYVGITRARTETIMAARKEWSQFAGEVVIPREE